MKFIAQEKQSAVIWKSTQSAGQKYTYAYYCKYSMAKVRLLCSRRPTPLYTYTLHTPHWYGRVVTWHARYTFRHHHQPLPIGHRYLSVIYKNSFKLILSIDWNDTWTMGSGSWPNTTHKHNLNLYANLKLKNNNGWVWNSLIILCLYPTLQAIILFINKTYFLMAGDAPVWPLYYLSVWPWSVLGSFKCKFG